MKKFILLLLTLLVTVLSLCVPLVSAEVQTLGRGLKQNTEINLKQTSGNSTYCNITSVNSPTLQTIIKNVQMQKDGNEYNYTLSIFQTNETGWYTVNGFCDEDGDIVVWNYDFHVNPAGKDLTIPQAILYLTVILFCIGLFSLCLYGAINIPFKNPRNKENELIGVNELKYVKLLLIVSTYIFGLTLIYMINSLAHGLLLFNDFHRILGIIYTIGLVMVYPILIIATLVFFIKFIEDKKTKRQLMRGFTIR